MSKVERTQTISKTGPASAHCNASNLQAMCSQALETCRFGVASVESVHWYFTQLENLFTTIQTLHGDKLSQVYQLAELGRFLSKDWANVVDCSREGFQSEFDRLNVLVSQAKLVGPCLHAEFESDIDRAKASGVSL